MNNNKLFFFILFFSVTFFVFAPAYAHKPIVSDGNNITFENALPIPDHKISWAIYEDLEPFQTKFYSFEAKQGDSFYSSIVIPKMERLQNFKPSLALVGEGIQIQNSHNIGVDLPSGGVVVYDYDGIIPSKEFYEPFGQTTYWDRQEVRISIPADGNYYIIVFDSRGLGGKYSLAVGTIEDFSMIDFVTILPTAWIQTKIFFEDYLSLGIFIGILGVILGLIARFGIKRIRKKRLIPHYSTKFKS